MEGNEQDLVEELREKFRVHFEQRNYQKAKEIAQRLLEIQTKAFGDDSIDVADTLNQLGGVLAWDRNRDEALEKFNRGLAIRLKKLGKHGDTAQSYMNIGQIFHEQQKDEEAEEMFQKALEIKREILPHNHPEVMGLYVHLVHSLKKQCKYSEAQKMQRLQLATLLELHGEDHYDVVNAYNGIASLLVCQNMLDDALQMVDRGIDICNRLERLGDRTIDVMGGTLRHKADILYEQGNMEAAADILNKVIMMMQIDTADAMHPAIAEMCEDLALKYYKHGIVEGAINAYEKAIKIRRKEFGNDHPHTKKLKLALKALACESDVRKLNELGLEMKAKGDSERAIQLFQEALGIDKSNIYAIGDTNASFLVRAAVYENISSVKVDQGLLEDAIAASAEALKIRRRTLGDDHCDTKRQMETHRSLLRRLLENRG